MDAHRRIFHARQGGSGISISIPGLPPIDPLDPFGIHHSDSASASASASASVSASASTSITDSASVSASASASPSSSKPLPSSTPTPTPTPTPAPNTTPAVSVVTAAPATVFQTVNVSRSSDAPSSSASALNGAVKPTGFLENKVLSGIVFSVIGIIGLTLIIFVATWFLRRSRNKRLVDEAVSFDPVKFDKDDYPEDAIEKGRISGSTTGGSVVPPGVARTPTMSNSGHDARSMHSVGSYATGSAAHGARPVSQAPPFADYAPPVPYLNSAPPTPRTQQQFSEQQQGPMHNVVRGNSVYNPYLPPTGYVQGPPPPPPVYAPAYYGQQPGHPSPPPAGYDHGGSFAGPEGDQARRSPSPKDLRSTTPGIERR